MRSIWFEYLDMWQCRGWGMRLWFSRSSHAGAYGSTETMEVARRPKSRAAAPDTPKKNLFDIGLDYFSESDTDDDCTLDGTATDTTKERIVDDKVAGLAPSKPLLLGFLYLACRKLRSWVIPADLVRWCQTGALPLSNLWESDCIPVAYRERFNSVPKSFEKKYVLVFVAFYFFLLYTTCSIGFFRHFFGLRRRCPQYPTCGFKLCCLQTLSAFRYLL